MPEQYTQVTKVGWGKKIEESLKGMILGIVLFVGSFFVLWFNEGRVDISKIAKKAIPLDPNFVNEKLEGKLISVTGKLETDQEIGDPSFLKPARYIKLERRVEMFAWVEKTKTETVKKLGGEEERITTYEYVKKWTFNPPDSSSFQYPEDHYNPPMTIQNETFFSDVAKVGVFEFSPTEIDLPRPSLISLSPENVILTGNAKLEGNYIFIGQGTLSNPQIGDTRISFNGIKSGQTVTVFGKLENGKIVPYYHQGKIKLYRVLLGSRDDAIAQMAKEHKTQIWLFRIIGFLMMWIGLNLIFKPISTILDLVPILGSISGGLIGVVTFIVSLVLSAVTILISMVFHNVFVFILVLGFGGIGTIYWLKRKKQFVATQK